MHTLQRRFHLIVGLAVVLVICLAGTSHAAGQRTLRDLDTIWGAVWDEYADPFFNGVDWHRLPDEVRPLIHEAETEEDAYRILAEMIDRLGDPSTFLVEPQPYYTFLESEYAGIGVLIGNASALNEIAQGAEFRDDEVAILEVFDGSPAQDAGILVGDVIVGVGDWTAGDDIDEVSDRVRGEIGTSVDIVVRDPDGELRTVTVVRDRVDLRPRTTFYHVADDVYYLRFDTLLSDHVEEAKESIAAQAQIGHLILDLRGISSGDPVAMSEVAGWFLGTAELGAFESRYDRFTLQTEPDTKLLYSDRLTVLINEGTGGLGEMLALLLSEYDRATLIGRPSAGGFSLTRLVRLPSGWGLSLSVARYQTPKGRGVHAEGLEPDVVLDSITLDALRQDNDPLLERTIEWALAQ